jgi:methyl-accepting chemotaxis protein
VVQGVSLVGETGKMLDRIVTKIADVNALINDIANSTNTQAGNLKQVNGAVVDMDKLTQQNAAMVEESTAAARQLAGEADELAALVSRFQLRSVVAAPRVKPATAPRPIARHAAAPARHRAATNLAVKIDGDNWTDF